MARQPRPPRGPHQSGAPRQPHGSPKPRGPAAPAMGLGSRAVGAAKSGGNLLREAVYSLADFLSKLLRRIFGKIMGSDLDQKRESKRAAADQEQENLDRLKAEKSDLERDLSRERESQNGPADEKGPRDHHSDLLKAADTLRDSGPPPKGKRSPDAKAEPAGPFWETQQLAGGAGSSPALPGGDQDGRDYSQGAGGASAFLESNNGDWRKALEAYSSGETTAGDLARYDVLNDLHQGTPYSKDSIQKAAERVQAIQASGAVERGDDAMFELLTCTAYIEAAAQNAKAEMHGPVLPELVEGDVEECASRIMEEVTAQGASPEEWTNALSTKASRSIQELEKGPQSDHGKALGHDPQSTQDQDNGTPKGGDDPASGRRPGLPGPGGPSLS